MCIRDRPNTFLASSMSAKAILILVCLVVAAMTQADTCPGRWTQGEKACLADGQCCHFAWGSWPSCANFQKLNEMAIRVLGRPTTKATLCVDYKEIHIKTGQKFPADKIYCKCQSRETSDGSPLTARFAQFSFIINLISLFVKWFL
eukprot:TRINITY_DN5544_c0_g1_i9.p1 TRINITY_DN5544_c0_g1~~TRINITY_DN5544_c0_g1_i9.p1  ORF type:complete len:146 (+),score=17.77 TRINITY_DN5544_c0_g1_i9:65-502(+)